MTVLRDYIPPFALCLSEQIKEYEARHSGEWENLPVEGQEDRIIARISEYYKEYTEIGTPIPWMKIAILAMIAWVKETYMREE